MRKILFLLVIFSFSFVSAFAQVSEILKRMEDHRKALKTLRADITMTKFSLQSGGIYTKEGVIKFMPVNDYSLRIDSTKPAPESFLTIKNQYLLYLPDLKTAYAGAMNDLQKYTLIIFSILSKERLKTDYNVKYLGEDKVTAEFRHGILSLRRKPPKASRQSSFGLTATECRFSRRLSKIAAIGQAFCSQICKKT